MNPNTLGVVMDPIDSIKPYKDTTFAIMLEAQRRGWTIYYMTPQDLFLEQGIAKAKTCQVKVFDRRDHWFEVAAFETLALSSLDFILMRQDPPVDSLYLHTSQLLAFAEAQGAIVVNRTGSVRDCNEKLFAQWFPELCPKTLVSANIDQIKEFISAQQDTILKPLDGMGGASIYRLKANDPNQTVIIQGLTHEGCQPVMIQQYLPAIADGDKRILLIDGKPIGYSLARIPMQGETRGNLAAGGTGEGRLLTTEELAICDKVGPTLKDKGLIFVGLDVIGDKLTEINVTSPTCVRELDHCFGINISALLLDALTDMRTRITR